MDGWMDAIHTTALLPPLWFCFSQWLPPTNQFKHMKEMRQKFAQQDRTDRAN
jgi:hypothetical protein